MSFLVHAINFSTKYFSSQVILMLAFMKATNVWIINFFLEHFQYLVSGFTTLMSINKLEKSYIVISKSILLFTFCVFLSSVCQGGKPWIISGFFSVQYQSVFLSSWSSENINTIIYEVSNNFRIRQFWFPNCRKWTNCETELWAVLHLWG